MSRALLFDLDRTLVDLQSFTDYGAAREDAARMAGDLADGAVPATDWSPDTQAVMALLVACSGDPRWDRVSEAIAVHEMAAVPRSTPMPRLAEAWALADGLPRAVVTLLPASVAREALLRHGLSTDDGLSLMGRRGDQRPKPAPDGLLAACAALGVPSSDAVMIGDSTWDLEAARAAGIPFIGVPTRPDALPAGTIVAADLYEAVREAISEASATSAG